MCLYQFYTHLWCKHESEAKEPPDFLQTSKKANMAVKTRMISRQDKTFITMILCTIFWYAVSPKR